MILISLSTMFLKQHSAFDSICAVALVIIVYLIVYYEPTYIPDKNNISEEIKPIFARILTSFTVMPYRVFLSLMASA